MHTGSKNRLDHIYFFTIHRLVCLNFLIETSLNTAPHELDNGFLAS